MNYYLPMHSSPPVNCSPSVTSRWDGETLIWVIEGIEILDSDLRLWCMIHMPDEWQKPHDGIIRKYHTTAWWQAWKRGDHLKANT